MLLNWVRKETGELTNHCVQHLLQSLLQVLDQFTTASSLDLVVVERLGKN